MNCENNARRADHLDRRGCDTGRRTKHPTSVVAVALLLAAGCSPRPGEGRRPEPGLTLSDQLRRHVDALSAGVGVRDWKNVAAANKAAGHVEAQMRAVGKGVVTVQPYEVNGATHYNVCLEVPGARTPREIVVVGAHYDTAEATPGADDNASGVAGVLALARRFASRPPPPRTVRFVAFGTEEPPYIRTEHMGSYHYARMCRQRGGNTDPAVGGDNVVAMISLEMLGYYSDEEGSQNAPLKGVYPTVGNFLAFAGHTGDRVAVARAARVFTDACGIDAQVMVLPAQLAIHARAPLGVNSSDQWSFWQWNYHGIMATDTANWRNPNYHRPTDLPETLDYQRMARAVEGLEAVVRDWAGETVEATAAPGLRGAPGAAGRTVP